MKSMAPGPEARRWTQFPWTAGPDEGSVRILMHPDTPDAAELRRRLTLDRMEQPFIFDTGNERRLHFSWKATQSTLLRLQPQALVAQYACKMMAFLLVNPAPRRILMLGLGGGELARFCYWQLPQCDITVVEFDPQVIALRDEFQIPGDDARFRVVQADGAAYVRALQTPVDAMLVDAFDRQGIALTLADPEFYLGAARNLPPDGVLVMNFWGATERFVENIKPAARAFHKNVRLVPTANGNIVLFAAHRALPTRISRDLERRATRLQGILQLDYPRFLRRLCQGECIA